jgi:hypothetical protein
LLGDLDASVYQFSNSNLDVGVKTMVRMGKLSGFTLSQDSLSVTPSVDNPNDYALLLYETVRSFVAGNPDSYSFKTRAVGERFGSCSTFLAELEQNIHELRNGTMFDGWQGFIGWVRGMGGLDPMALMTRLTVDAPIQTVSVGVDGMRVS